MARIGRELEKVLEDGKRKRVMMKKVRLDWVRAWMVWEGTEGRGVPCSSQTSTASISNNSVDQHQQQ